VAHPPEQRAAANVRYNRHRVTAPGLAKVNVLVPVHRMTEPATLLVEWRRVARAQLDTDQPSAEQILNIHAVCRTLRLRLPVGAFATRFTAEAWLREKRPALEGRDLMMPHRPRATWKHQQLERAQVGQEIAMQTASAPLTTVHQPLQSEWKLMNNTVGRNADGPCGQQNSLPYAGVYGEPGPPAGMSRLYRAESAAPADWSKLPEWLREAVERSGATAASGRWFAADRDNVDWYCQHLRNSGLPPRVVYVDIAAQEVAKYRVANQPQIQQYSRRPEEEYFLPKELAEVRRPLPAIDSVQAARQMTTLIEGTRWRW
jgi:hypothetical protein